jgi:hypothetical protein
LETGQTGLPSQNITVPILATNNAVGEFCGKRFVVAISVDTMMHLMFRVCKNVYQGDSLYFCSFDVNQHGCAHWQIKSEAACISVKMIVAPPM